MTTETHSIDGVTPEEIPAGLPARSGSQAATPVRVVMLGLALFTLLGAFAILVMPRGGAISHEELEAELFEDTAGPLPFQLSPAGARRLPSFERVLTYTRDPELEGAMPVELTVIDYPAARAEAVFKDQFNKLRFATGGPGGHGGGGRPRGGRGRRGDGRPDGGPGDDDGPKGPTLRDAGFLDWHGYRANYARLRHSIPEAEGDDAEGDDAEDRSQGGGSDPGEPLEGEGAEAKPPGDARNPGPYYETVRVNLSTGGRCVIAYVRFPPNVVGSKEAADSIVASFRPRDD